jgi:hypothetical protein
MARIPRLGWPNIPQHIVQSGNNRQAIFFHEDGYNIYLGCLREAVAKHGGRLFPWSSFRAHGGERVIDWLSESEKYRRLTASRKHVS